MKRIYVIFFIIIILIILYILEFEFNHVYRFITEYKNFKLDKKKLITIRVIREKEDKSFYNPSLIFHDNHFYIIKRFNKLDKIISNIISNNNYIKDDHQFIGKLEKRDKNFKLLESKDLYVYCKDCIDKKIYKSYTLTQYDEDIRIIKIIDDKIIVSYTRVEKICLVGLGYIDLKSKEGIVHHTITFTKNNNEKITHPEKSWQIVKNPSKEVLTILSKYNYNEDKHLLMLTYATPLWIVSLVDIEEGNKIDIPEFTYNLGKKLVNMKWPSISKISYKKSVSIEKNLRCSSSLEVINDSFYLTLLHTFKPYYTVFCLVDIKTLEPKYIYGPVKFKKYPCIEYASSLKIIEDIVYIGLGVNDIKVEIILINREYLLNKILLEHY